ncbi:MAG: DUF3775 domain-containing protein [Rhodobiaceae bacterium]|nr:DUF3775 domain-containing protein [Rhodobiaceae bacterium]
MLAQRTRAAAAPSEDTDHDGDIHETEFDSDSLSADHHHDDLVEEESTGAYAEELAELLDDLNVDEAAELVAIVWIGRGDYDASDWDEALSQAHARRSGPTTKYLANMPLLADFIEAGLDALEL